MKTARNSSSPIETPVLIVGAGMAGLTTAVMLAFRGIRPLLIERHADTSQQPKARGVNFRTMELLRVAGLEEELCKAGGDRFSDFTMVIAETVTGRVLKTIMPRGSLDTSSWSPAKAASVGQERIEPILRRRAEELGGDLRFATELVSLEQHEHGVQAVIRDRQTLRKQTVNARYLVAADGHRSPIRKLLNIGTHGHGSLAHHMSILFETEDDLPTKGHGFALYYLQNPAFNGAFVTTDEPNRALITLGYDPTKDTKEDFTPERCIQMVRDALGLPEFDVRVLNVASWEMTSRVADRFTDGRVFLIGDAAHTMPPTGGLGGQTAMQDGADLAWKLALVLQGIAGTKLLDTYEAERKPVAEMTVAVQTQNYIERMRPDRAELISDTPKLDYISVAVGPRYRSETILQDEADDGAPAENPAHPSGRPGTRAPHVELMRDGQRLSTIDLMGRSFVLFTGSDAAPWAQAGVAAAMKLGVPLEIHRIDMDVVDVHSVWAQRCGVTDQGAVLVRPDGYIAWRSRAASTEPDAALETALERILFLPLDSAEVSATVRAPAFVS